MTIRFCGSREVCLFTRCGNASPKGWRIDPGDGFEFHFKAASALAGVTSELPEFARSFGTRLVHLMMTTELQIGWLPNGPYDPILVGLFAHAANDDPS